MKKKIFLVMAAMMVMGLAIAAFAYSRTSASETTAGASCCDTCPMKRSDTSGAPASHENCDHSKAGHAESCPMKGKGEAAATEMKAGHESCPLKAKAAAAAATAVKADKGDTCPMKKGDAAAVAAGTLVKHDPAAGDACCCPCCSEKKEKKDAPVV